MNKVTALLNILSSEITYEVKEVKELAEKELGISDSHARRIIWELLAKNKLELTKKLKLKKV